MCVCVCLRVCLCGLVTAVCFVSSIITDLHFIMQRQKHRLMYNVPFKLIEKSAVAQITLPGREFVEYESLKYFFQNSDTEQMFII